MSYIMSSYPEKKCSLPQLLKFINPAKHGIFIAFIMFVILSPAIQLADAQAGPDQSKDPYAYAKFSPSMAIIIVVLVAALFFMAFFSIYIRHCNESRTGSSLRPNGGSIRGRSRRAARGLDPTVIETFPTFAYSVVKGLKIGKGALECAVCLNEFEEDETLRLLPKCDHVFHPECIDAWLASHTTCPVCRANLAAPADEVVADEVVVEVSDSDSDTDELTPGSELQNSTSIRVTEDEDRDQAEQPIRPQVIDPSRSVHQNRPGRSKSITSRFFPKYPRSHSTGHSLIQPGENVDRFTLRLPTDVRKQIMNKTLNRASSLVILPRETSSRRGYRLGGEGSGRGRHFSFRRLERLDQEVKSDRWVFSRTPPFFSRASSLRSPKVMTDDGEGTSSEVPKGSNAV